MNEKLIISGEFKPINHVGYSEKNNFWLRIILFVNLSKDYFVLKLSIVSTYNAIIDLNFS